MGRAIVRDPQVFLFDEPLSNLDAKLRVAMRTEIKELHQRLGTTTVYVTHDQIEAMTMADKIVVMHDGEVEQIGAPLDLYDTPANLFVAGFIGSPAMNFLERQDRPRRRRFDVERAQLAGPRRARSAQDGQEVIYGIRPEHLAVRDDGTEVEVVVVEPTGAEVQIVARLDGQDITAVLRERLMLQARRARQASRPTRALVHLFDRRLAAHLNRDARDQSRQKARPQGGGRQWEFQDAIFCVQAPASPSAPPAPAAAAARRPSRRT